MFLFPEAMDPLEVHPPACAQEKLVNPLTAKPRIPLAPATQFLDQPSFIVRLAAMVTLRRARLTQHSADTAFRHAITPQATADHLNSPPASLGAHQFGRAASRRIWLSNAWSATSRLSRAFSFCNSCS